MGSCYMTMKWFASKFQMKAVFFSESISFKMFLKILKEQSRETENLVYIFSDFTLREKLELIYFH